jgi:ABC-type Fe3+ transport system permease subunit
MHGLAQGVAHSPQVRPGAMPKRTRGTARSMRKHVICVIGASARAPRPARLNQAVRSSKSCAATILRAQSWTHAMIRFVLRTLGLWILALGFIFLIYDGTKSIAGDQVYFTKLGEVWNWINSTSLQLLQPAIERHVAEWLWNPVILSVLTAPACLVFAILGAILMLLGRKKKPLIGYAR